MSKSSNNCRKGRACANCSGRQVIAGMDAAEMEETFAGREEEGYHPFRDVEGILRLR